MAEVDPDSIAKAASKEKGQRRDALIAVDACLKAADPRGIIRRSVRCDGRVLRVGTLRLSLRSYDRVFVIGGGKASALLAEGLESILGGRVLEGRVIIPQAQRSVPRLSRIRFRRSSHPLPSAKSVRSVEWMLRLVKDVGADDLVVCVISGGGSSLMSLPAKGVTVVQKQQVTELLLKTGATIAETNCVRKHLSAFKGGRLAEILHPARVLSLIVSDVAGDDLASVASGPTVPDPTNYDQAKRILLRREIWRLVPKQVRVLIEAGIKGAVAETPKPGDPIFARVDNILVGSNREPLWAAVGSLRTRGYQSRLLSANVSGEAREFGRKLGSLTIKSSRAARPTALVAGGETTVTVTGSGKGGRNQEVALAAAIRISGHMGVTVVSLGTDGVDGETRAAGAMVDWDTIARGRALGMEASDYLRNNDSYSYFARLGDLIVTGPTGTNVNDVMIALARKK